MKEYMFDNISIYVGERAAENDAMVREYADSPLFIWLHLEKFPSGHVVICSDQIDNIALIRFAANLCKLHSKVREIPKVYVNYTQIQNVRPTHTLGCVTFLSNKKVRRICV